MSLSVHAIGPDEVAATGTSAEAWSGVSSGLAAAGGWHLVEDASRADGFCLCSDEVAAGETAEIALSLPVAGALSFDWKISSNRGHNARFYVDGAVQRTITRSTDWATVELALGDGPHTLRWTYEKGSGATAGEDAAFLDDVRWTPLTLEGALDAPGLVWTTTGGGTQYEIVFDTLGGSAVAPVVASVGAAVAAPETPTRTGYSFAGWQPEMPATMPEGGAALTARWDVRRATVSFDPAGGSAVAPVVAYPGTPLPAAKPSVRNGYDFDGWNPPMPAVMPEEDLTLTAQWTGLPFTLWFYSNGGTDVESITQICGSAITPPDDPTRAGYDFAGWQPAVPGTMPPDGGTCRAQWTPHRYTVRFAANGGEGTMADEALNYGEWKRLPANAFTRFEHSFRGWATSANGAVAYYDGDWVGNLAVDDRAVVTLYAVWTPNVVVPNAEEWTTGTYTTFSPASISENLLRASGVTYTGGNAHEREDGYSMDNPGKMTDGSIDSGLSLSDKQYRFAVTSGQILSWTLPAAATLREVRIYNIWGDSGRDRINITSIEALSGGVWTVISPNPVSCEDPNAGGYEEGRPGRPYAILATQGGSPLATGVTAIRITWGTAEAGFVGIGEIEAIGAY